MTERQVYPISKEEQVGRVWTCKAGNDPCSRQAPCRSCLGRRNRRSGLSKQRKARKALESVTGAQTARFSTLTSNEEAWGQPVRVEVKSGAIAKPVGTRFLLSETQSAASKPHGDPRPFTAIFMPPGWGSDGVFCCRLSELSRVVEALLNE